VGCFLLVRQLDKKRTTCSEKEFEDSGRAKKGCFRTRKGQNVHLSRGGNWTGGRELQKIEGGKKVIWEKRLSNQDTGRGTSQMFGLEVETKKR